MTGLLYGVGHVKRAKVTQQKCVRLILNLNLIIIVLSYKFGFV